MIRFWKFNSFVGVVSVVLLVVAFFMGDHSFVVNWNTPEFILNVKVVAVSSYIAFAGSVGVSYLIMVTLLGLLAGFFRAPTNGR